MHFPISELLLNKRFVIYSFPHLLCLPKSIFHLGKKKKSVCIQATRFVIKHHLKIMICNLKCKFSVPFMSLLYNYFVDLCLGDYLIPSSMKNKEWLKVSQWNKYTNCWHKGESFKKSLCLFAQQRNQSKKDTTQRP